jgi:drug/metabolite transporter (DMT)-like permease
MVKATYRLKRVISDHLRSNRVAPHVIIGLMLGVIIALVASLAWAGSSTLLKYLSSRIDAISVNTMRLWVGSIALVALVIFSGRSSDILQAPVFSILMVVASGILSNTIGDTIYIRSLSYLDVSISYPISQSAFPVLTLIAAIFFLNETFKWFNIIGAVFVISGILMIVKNNKQVVIHKNTGKGVALTLIAAVLWAAGSITLKIGLTQVDTFVAAAIRVLISATLLTAVAFGRPAPDSLKIRSYGTRNLILVASAGFLTYGVGAIGYVTAMHLIGAGKTVLLSASAPVFLLPMSVLILKERLSLIALTGVFIAVAGIYLVAL